MLIKDQTKILKYAFLTVIVLLIGIIISVFIRSQIRLKNILNPLSPKKTSANLTIQNFRHTAIKDGQKQWSIDASTANLYSEQRIAELINISGSFFAKESETVSISADNGRLNIDTNDITLSGHIMVKFPDYVITTENLNYFHNSNMIHSNTPVLITAKTMTLSADTMSYNLKKDQMECQGNVKASFNRLTE